MSRNNFSQLVVMTLFAAVTILTGCKSVPVDILSMTAPDSLMTNQNGNFAVTINEKAKLPVDVSWNFGDSKSAKGTTTSHAFTAPGTYTVSVTASNRKGKSTDVATASVVVMNPSVAASIVSLRASNNSPDTQTGVTFSASVNGDAPLSYAWTFGDGGTSSNASPSHTFTKPGSYTVQLNVSNKSGSDSRTMTLNVSMYEAQICKDVSQLGAAFFSANDSVLSAEARGVLTENLEILNECPNMNVRVEGVSAPGERRAQELSEDRARAVEQYYTSNGVAAARVVTVGKGRAEGLTSKKEGLAQYRRVDTIVVR